MGFWWMLAGALVAMMASEASATIDVTRFGAVPDDDRDDTAAFLAAFQRARETEAHTIVIPKGRYRLRANGNSSHPDTLLPMEKTDGLTINGAGAELMMSGNGGVFSCAMCRNVTVRGLTIDWERPPFSEGTVVATTPRSFDVKVRDEYPVHGGEPVGAFMTYHPDSRLPDGRDLDVYGAVESTELVSPQVLRVHLNREIPVPVGKLLVLRHRVYDHSAFVFSRCRGVVVKDVTIYAAPGMAFVNSVCEDVTYQRVQVRIRPGSGRLMSATADATHFGGCKGTVTLEDCLFEGMGDDGANIKSGLYLTVLKRIDDHTVLGQHNLKMVDLPDAGDTMEMCHVDTLSPYGSGRVRSATLEPGEGNVHRVVFEDPLPAGLHEGDVLGNASRAPRLRMRGCTISANRARGVLCQTRDAVIESCTFRNCTGPGVMVLTEVVYFYESIGTRNVTVRNNRFVSCNMGAAGGEAALCALAYLHNFAYPKVPGVHRDVTFEGNRITGTAESGIFAVGVDGLTVRDNTVERACLRGDRETGRYAIRVLDCARVAISRNEIDPAKQGPRMKAPILQ